jgi:hypothetical protein
VRTRREKQQVSEARFLEPYGGVGLHLVPRHQPPWEYVLDWVESITGKFRELRLPCSVLTYYEGMETGMKIEISGKRFEHSSIVRITSTWFR